MKATISFFLFIICFLTNCTSEHIYINESSDSRYIVRFYLDPQPDIEPFPDTKSIPPNFPPEPVACKSGESEGENKDLSFSFIEYAVYDAEEDTLVHHIRFSKSDPSLDDFGLYIYDTLRAGNYNVCALTHSIQDASLADNILTFPNIGDTFYGFSNVEINVNTVEQQKEILLKRIVSRVEFVATDSVPDIVKTFHLSVPERYNKFNIFTGEVIDESVPYSSIHTFTAEERGEGIFNTHAFFTFVPAEEDIKLPATTLIAKDNTSNEVRKRTIKNIPIVANKITRYKGILYTPGIFDDGFKLSFENDGKWGEPIETDLPED